MTTTELRKPAVKTLTTADILKNPLPLRFQLMEGAYLLIPGSTKGGPGKTTIVYTMAAALRMLGIPYVVGSFDDTNTALEQSLGKENIIQLDAQTPELARKSMAEMTRQCRERRAVGLMDLPGAVDNKESQLMDNIRAARVLERCDKLLMISPVRPDRVELECAFNAINLFSPDKLLIRAWRPNKHSPAWDTFPAWAVLSEYPQWECENWTQAQKDVFTRSGNYENLPVVPELADYLRDNEQMLEEVKLLDIEDAVIHVEHIAKIIYYHLLREITEPIPDSIPQATEEPPETPETKQSAKATKAGKPVEDAS